MNIENILDIEDLKKRFEDDFELFCELAELFIQDSEKHMQRIKDTIANNDIDGLRKSSHTLKGSVSNFSAPMAYETAKDIEQMARESEIEKLDEKYCQLRTSIDDTKSALKELIIRKSF